MHKGRGRQAAALPPALEEYKNQRITKADLRRLLGIGTRDLKQEREDLRRLGY